ncbi:hypothetical protein ACFU6K_28630 [Kitasatospora sp. NPDC057512]|uniref:hypothetical protein n=1 Tax=Kitasatospora sp. NPDC057512 TaxID=3346154 RepID=UPI0036965151
MADPKNDNQTPPEVLAEVDSDADIDATVTETGSDIIIGCSGFDINSQATFYV